MPCCCVLMGRTERERERERERALTPKNLDREMGNANQIGAR